MNDKAPRAGLGETLAQARTGGFFLWFHLTEVDDVAAIHAGGRDDGMAWHRFRPSGERFRPLVELALGIDDQGRIAASCLGVDRGFIGSPASRPFARDIVKSYLQWILPADAAAALDTETDAIGQFCDGESVVIVRQSAVRPSLFDARGAGDGGIADVFMGQAAVAECQVGRTRIAFENLIEPLPQGVMSEPRARRAVPKTDEDAWLRITVAAATG